ncbi:MAG: siderophore-interacting protein, partial [Acidimicrobiales bacterium]|nr:siderophore-interacting protein [Acidimicrobiales bacterium]
SDTELLLIADDTGLPALCAVAESLAPGQRARAFIEVADEREHQPISSEATIETTWLHRDGTPPGLSPALVDAVLSLPTPSSATYVWGGGESRIMTRIRKHVRREWGLAREQVDLTPYWRHKDSPVPTPEDDE